MKAIYWRETRTLIISDLHLGKLQHFRKSGIPVPAIAGKNNFQRLEQLVAQFRPERVLLLGDLFHSEKNMIWAEWERFIVKHHNLRFDLVMGNHDIFDLDIYLNSGMGVFAPGLEAGPFYFSHDDRIEFSGEKYNIFGHLHPSIRLVSKSRDGMRLPCFYFSDEYAILPAFGAFTGTKTIRPRSNDRVFGIIEGEVVDLAPMMNAD